MRTMRTHDPGVPYTLVAIVLDHYAGYNAYQERPWEILESTPCDLETRVVVKGQWDHRDI